MGIETILLVGGVILVVLAWRFASKAKRTGDAGRSPTDPTVQTRNKP